MVTVAVHLVFALVLGVSLNATGPEMKDQPNWEPEIQEKKIYEKNIEREKDLGSGGTI